MDFKLILRFSLFFIFLGFFSCVNSCPVQNEVNRLRNFYVKKLKKDQQFELFCINGSMKNKDQKIGLTLSSHKKVDIHEARILLVRTAKEFLEIINADAEIKPYIFEYPFTNKNIKIGIVFFDEDNHYYQSNLIADVLNVNGKVYYSRYPGGGQLEDVHEETYEEALRIVQEDSFSKNDLE